MHTSEILVHVNDLVARADEKSRPPIYKAVGLILAVCSGLFIGTSFVLKKTGLLKANAKYDEEAGEGYGYLKNAWWWSGMTLMIVGEICNFVAYAFVDAILVTPLGALSVVVTTILSAIFLKERLSFVGKVGCFNCIVGSIVIVLNAPAQSSVATIQDMKHFVLAPGFLSYAGVIVVGCAFIALWVGPRYGKKTMMVYLSICSLIGGLSVVATQGLGAAIVAQAGGTPQFNQWFLYLLLVFVILTLVTEIIFLNKALNLFNAALVTPTYYVFFTSATIVTSSILFQGFKGTPLGITTVIMGFLQICAGVVLLQLSKSAKDVPDAAVFKGDLDQMREVAEQEQPETEPKADAIRGAGAASIIRRFSVSRQKMEEAEAKRLRDEKRLELLEPLGENEIAEWDGLRRRKTIIGESPLSPPQRRKTIHPPLGMSSFPAENGNEETDSVSDREPNRLLQSVRRGTKHLIPRHHSTAPGALNSPLHPVALTEISVQPSKSDSPIRPFGPGSYEEAQEHIYGLPPSLDRGYDGDGTASPRSKPNTSFPRTQSPASQIRLPSQVPTPPPHTSRRQFSFTNVFHRAARTPDPVDPLAPVKPPPSRQGLGSRTSSNQSHEQKRAMKTATEEERLGLVKGDSHHALLDDQPHAPAHFHSTSSTPEKQRLYHDPHQAPSPVPSEDDDEDDWQMMNLRRTESPSSIHLATAPSQSVAPPLRRIASQQHRLRNTHSRSKLDLEAAGAPLPPRPSPSSESIPTTSLQPSPSLHPSPPRHRTYQIQAAPSAASASQLAPPRTAAGAGGARTLTSDDYEESKRRFVDQQQQQIQDRSRQQQGPRGRGGGGGNIGNASFI